MKKAWILFCNGIVWDVVFSGKLAKELIEEIYNTQVDPVHNIERFDNNTFSICAGGDIITIKRMIVTGDGR